MPCPWSPLLVAKDIGTGRQRILEGVDRFIPEEAPEELVEKVRAFRKTT